MGTNKFLQIQSLHVGCTVSVYNSIVCLFPRNAVEKPLFCHFLPILAILIFAILLFSSRFFPLSLLTPDCISRFITTAPKHQCRSPSVLYCTVLHCTVLTLCTVFCCNVRSQEEWQQQGGHLS